MNPGKRSNGNRDSRAWLRVVFGAGLASACGVHAGYQRLANGDLHVACDGPLLACLMPAADACAGYGYAVVKAEELHDTTGAEPEQQTFVRSDATVRCRESVPVFGTDPNKVPATGATASASSVATGAPPRCVPGVSQSCATPTCAGAQVCAADGTHFGACECAAPVAAPSTSSTPLSPP